MRRFPEVFPGTAAVALLIACVPAFAGSQDFAAPDLRPSTGRVAGTVAVGPELLSRKIRFHLYPDLVVPANLAPAPQSAGHETANVVVYLESEPPGAGPAPVPEVRHVMRQEGLSFVPHVLAVPKGSVVEFPNADPIFHNVFSLSRAAVFDLGRYPSGASKSVRFDKPGVVKVFCHIHSDMSGVIVVLDNPYFGVPDAQGRYGIDGVPPGEYRLVAWHERARPLSTTVAIEPGRTAAVDFTIPLKEFPGGR